MDTTITMVITTLNGVNICSIYKYMYIYIYLFGFARMVMMEIIWIWK